MDQDTKTRGQPRPDGRARDPDPRNEHAAGGEPAAQDQSRAPTGGDADRQDVGITLTRADGIKPERINWVWVGWVARGKVHVIAGAPGTGKTTAAVALAGRLTTGGRWPDGTRAPVGDVPLCQERMTPRTRCYRV